MRKSFADCVNCMLHDSSGKVCETNSPKDLKNIEEFYIANVEDWSLLIDHLKNKSVRYLITAPVLCANEHEDFKVMSVVAETCKPNALALIQKCTPKKIFSIGPIAEKFKDEYKSTHYDFITDLVKIEKVDKISEDLLADFAILKDVPENPVQAKVLKDKDIELVGNDNIYMFRVPDKYYSEDYRLVDVQNIANQSRIIYIFRDKNNKKEYYEAPMKQNNFYWYESHSADNKNIEPYRDLKLKIGNHKERCITPLGYGGDVNLTTLHSVDYFLQNKAEGAFNKNTVFFDIEVYTYGKRIFPDPAQSSYPINAFSFREDSGDHTSMYLLKINGEIDPRIDEVMNSGKYKNLTLFTDEYSMIKAFLSKIRSIDPDFLSGWNTNSFDWPYLVGRMKKLSIDMKDLSPYGNVYADARGRVIMTGFVALDQLELFKNDTTRPAQPSYKLDSIAELITGKRKVDHTGVNLDQLYNNDIDKYIEYSITDTDLLKDIEDQVQHIALQDELRQITTSSHSGAASTLGQAEGLFMTSMKKKGLIARNKPEHIEKEELPGAYVFDARGGLYNGIIIDFDFTSLYPSIINSNNLGPDTYIAKISENDAFNIIYHNSTVKELEVTIDPIHKGTTKKMTKTEFDKFVKDNKAIINITGSIFCGHEQYLSIFNTVISMLFEGRKIYKAKMFEAKQAKDKKMQTSYNGKQMAFKILANSLYGALGNEHFKFYHNDLAKSITLTGQELLKYSTVHLDEYLVKRGNIGTFKVNTKFMDKVKSLTDVLYGDTDSAFVCLTNYLIDKKMEVKKSPEVLEEINKIQNFINNIALDEFLKLHNIPKSKSMIHMKNEYIFSRYYTLNGKKHYACKVIAQEGRDVNEIEVKGIEIRRSEIPKKSREILKEILDIILDDKIEKKDIKPKVDKIAERAKKEITDLAEKRDKSIVRTVAYSKSLKEYKAMPQHIKAMLIWNELVNEDFRLGSKGTLWNLRAVDETKMPENIKNNFHNKLLKKYKLADVDVICVPEDVEVLPIYCIPDIKKIVEYACTDRISNLTEPLWQEQQQILLW